jgi:hypothetical protein
MWGTDCLIELFGLCEEFSLIGRSEQFVVRHRTPQQIGQASVTELTTA